MDVEGLVSRYPVLYHMAEDGSWESIRETGLLSTSALLDRLEVNGERRYRLESCRRPEIVEIRHPRFGTASIRDNKPIQEHALERCLRGMTPREWYENLNRRVFFWVDRGRVLKLLNARPYRHRPHVVLELDTASLLERHAPKISLSPINSGATFPMNPAPRSPETFSRIPDHPESRPVVELVADYAVPDITDFVLSVTRWLGPKMLEEIWTSERGGRR